MTALLERLEWEVESTYEGTGFCSCCEPEHDEADEDVFVRSYSGDTLVARGELRPGTIFARAGIWGIFVDEAHRGRGHAREVMRRLIDEGVRRGYSDLWLHVESDNTIAIALYHSLGFTVYSCDSVTTMKLDLN